MKPVLFALLLFFAARPALAQECPSPPDHSRAQDALIARIQGAQDEISARVLFNDLWQYWADAPDERAQEILDSGMRKRASWDLLGALEDFDRLIAYCPQYAEGYNQRAFVNFLRRDYTVALPDLERAIALSPRHIAAHSGRALTLFGLGRAEEAQAALAAALALNPWLPERTLASPAPEAAPSGQEL
ncbi:tetratricopeptide repeat protein [Shimia sp.]|uniref:tetratricopeptide repeat protein n=1 Tax=Shimia sp. TaxID=1954381 RepID=UPI0035672EF5